MPYNLQIANAAAFSGAVLPSVPTLDSVIAGLPGLLGAFDAADCPPTGTWLPRIGTNGQIVLAAAGTPPSKQTRDGRDVLRFSIGSKAFVNDGTGAALSLSALTFAERAYYSDSATNFQKIFDLGTAEFFFRSTTATPIWQFSGLGTAGSVNIGTPLLGWHKTLFTKTGTDAAQFEFDGGALAAIGSSGTAMSGLTMVLGDAANATSAARDITRLIICSAGALTADQRTAVNTWIGL